MLVSSIFHNIALILFLLFLGLVCLKLKKQSVVIIMALLLIGGLMVEELPKWQHFKDSSDFVLIFACLIPTLTLVRSSAMTMPSVIQTQKRLGALEPASSASGIQITSHALGGIINVGTFALVAVALPRDADIERRYIAGMATLRGMNSAILWSPFFLSFAVASVYLPEGFAIGAIILGIFNAVIFFLVTQKMTAPNYGLVSILQSISPLRPIYTRLILVILSVIFTSALLGLTALSAVCVAMPILCIVQFFRRPEKVKQIWANFISLQKNSGDEVAIISLSMLIASQLGQTDQITFLLTSFFGLMPNIKIILICLPFLVWAGSVVGIHPVISSAPLLAFFAPNLTVYDAAFVAQAHMIGWSTGTMVSFASLSTIIASENFKIRPVQVSFGQNFVLAAGLAIGGGLLLGLFHSIFINLAIT
tara:strand:- start:268 stop:1530 length:1263 start_codon:yes stop_codon:yes gene_type:complete